MALDRSRLTSDERDELHRALVARRANLARRLSADPDGRVGRDARWRLFVVNGLLDELDR